MKTRKSLPSNSRSNCCLFLAAARSFKALGRQVQKASLLGGTLAVGILLGTMLPGHASLIAYDGFDYTLPSDVNGDNGGTGWAAAWSATGSGSLHTNSSPGLAYNNLTVVGGAAFFRGRTSGVTSQVAFRTFASAVDLTAGDLWIGVLGQYTGVPGSPATYRYFDIGLYSAGTGAGNQVFDIDNGSTGATGFWNIQSVTNVVASTVSGSTKSFLVARVTSGSVYFWINPSPATMASGILTTGDASYVGSVTLVGVTTTADRIRINAGGLTSGSIGQGFADEVRVGTTFSDVAPVTVHTPHITGLVLAGTMLTMTATNGANNGQFVLLESTNVAVPLAQWTPVLTNTFDGGGNLNLSTNILNMGNTKAFYILSQ